MSNATTLKSFMGRKRAVLYIDTWSSECGNCGKSCDPDEKTHSKIYGYGADNGKPGCGIRWKYLASHYTGMDEQLKQMRPDLEFIGFYITSPAHSKTAFIGKGEK